MNVQPASKPIDANGGNVAFSPPPEAQLSVAVAAGPSVGRSLANGDHPFAGAGLPSGSLQE
jgi:hypothetical protein